MPVPIPISRCPCDEQRRYADCCEPLHRGAEAPDAEALMRSRYSAYALHLEPYLLSTWHPRTRPDSLGFGKEPKQKWLGLKILRHQHAPDADEAIVEFVARFRAGGGSAQRMHEVSRFVREEGRWFYLDGDVG